MRYLILFLILLPLSICSAQEQDKTPKVVDSLYREDQIYASLTYNALANLNPNVTVNGFSAGFHLGVIRDMPINKRRNMALGLGLGISSNTYNQNILISELAGGGYSYEFFDPGINVTQNRFSTYAIDVPLELRWRTSTPTVNTFWRVYPGFKLSYLFYNTTKTRTDAGNSNLSNVADFNTLQYALTLSVGYGDWNFQFYYALNPIFNDNAVLNGQALDISAMRIGIIFYIL
jgi:hypothetical protein